jgi:hypothetical protein
LEVVERIARNIPGAAIVRREAYDPVSSDASARLIYRWSKEERTLHPVAGR